MKRCQQLLWMDQQQKGSPAASVKLHLRLVSVILEAQLFY